MTPQTSSKPTVSAVVSGAVSGLIIFAILVLIDHFIFSSRETARFGLLATLLGAAISGAVFGAIVGLVVATTRSMPAGIATGAVLFAALKLLTIGSLGAFTGVAVVFGLLYGAVFGWSVASSAAKAMEAS